MKAKVKKKKSRNKTDRTHQPRGGSKAMIVVKSEAWLKSDMIAIGENMEPKCTLTQVVIQALINYRRENEHLIAP
jgi:hypothetical protein